MLRYDPEDDLWENSIRFIICLFLVSFLFCVYTFLILEETDSWILASTPPSLEPGGSFPGGGSSGFGGQNGPNGPNGGGYIMAMLPQGSREDTSSVTRSSSALPIESSVQEIPTQAIPAQQTGYWERILPAPHRASPEMVKANADLENVKQWGPAQEAASRASWHNNRSDLLAGRDASGGVGHRPVDIGPYTNRLAPIKTAPVSTNGHILYVDTRQGPISLTKPPNPPGWG